jgi:Glyoxalase-like domain
MLELDHVFCLVPPPGDWATRLTASGWALDAGTAHPRQGSRNRRISWAEQYLELLWIDDADSARNHPLRLDLRADWARTGASPFGFGLRGRLPDELRPAYRPLDGLPLEVWVHRDSQDDRRKPLVFVLDLSTLPPDRSGGRTSTGRPAAPANQGHLRAVTHTGPAPAPLPRHTGPPVTHAPGPHRLELTADGGTAISVAELVALSP